MAKNSILCKQKMVNEVSPLITEARMLIVTNYKGLSSGDMNVLRKDLRGVSSKYLVVKNSIAQRVLGGNNNNRITELIKEEVGIVINQKGDPSYLAKVVIKFSKEHEALKITGGFMDGSLLSRENIAELASLPSRDALLGKLANVLNAPIQGLAGALKGIICKLVYALNVVKDKK